MSQLVFSSYGLGIRVLKWQDASNKGARLNRSLIRRRDSAGTSAAFRERDGTGIAVIPALLNGNQRTYAYWVLALVINVTPIKRDERQFHDNDKTTCITSKTKLINIISKISL